MRFSSFSILFVLPRVCSVGDGHFNAAAELQHKTRTKKIYWISITSYFFGAVAQVVQCNVSNAEHLNSIQTTNLHSNCGFIICRLRRNDHGRRCEDNKNMNSPGDKPKIFMWLKDACHVDYTLVMQWSHWREDLRFSMQNNHFSRVCRFVCDFSFVFILGHSIHTGRFDRHQPTHTRHTRFSEMSMSVMWIDDGEQPAAAATQKCRIKSAQFA